MEGKGAVLFDFGGTLANTEGVVLSALSSALASSGLGRIENEEFLSLFSGPFHENLQKRFPALRDQRKLSEFSVNFSKAKMTQLPSLFPGIAELLRGLSEKGFSLYIVSAANEEFIRRTLLDAGVLGCFEGMLGVESGKSKLEKIRKVFSLGGFSPEDCVYVGDASGDILDAKSAGISQIAVLWGYHDKEALSGAGAKNFAETAEDVASLCERILGRGKNG